MRTRLLALLLGLAGLASLAAGVHHVRHGGCHHGCHHDGWHHRGWHEDGRSCDTVAQPAAEADDEVTDDAPAAHR